MGRQEKKRKQYLWDLQNLAIELKDINGLLYILREALRINEDILNIHYTLASAYISNRLMEFVEDFDALTEDMFRILGNGAIPNR